MANLPSPRVIARMRFNDESKIFVSSSRSSIGGYGTIDELCSQYRETLPELYKQHCAPGRPTWEGFRRVGIGGDLG